MSSKRSIKPYVVSLLGAGLVGCGSQYSECPLSLEHVCIRVINQNDLDISTLVIAHEGGQEESGSIASGRMRTIYFFSPGENAYRLVAVLSSGDTIRSPENYVEGGFRFTETLGSDGFRNSTEKY